MSDMSRIDTSTAREIRGADLLASLQALIVDQQREIDAVHELCGERGATIARLETELAAAREGRDYTC